MTELVLDTASLALAAGHPRRKLLKMSWLGGAVLSAGEALLGIEMQSVYSTITRLRWAPSAILSRLHSRRGGGSLAVAANGLGSATAYALQPGRLSFDAPAALAATAYASRHRPRAL